MMVVVVGATGVVQGEDPRPGGPLPGDPHPGGLAPHLSHPGICPPPPTTTPITTTGGWGVTPTFAGLPRDRDLLGLGTATGIPHWGHNTATAGMRGSVVRATEETLGTTATSGTMSSGTGTFGGEGQGRLSWTSTRVPHPDQNIRTANIHLAVNRKFLFVSHIRSTFSRQTSRY